MGKINELKVISLSFWRQHSTNKLGRGFPPSFCCCPFFRTFSHVVSFGRVAKLFHCMQQQRTCAFGFYSFACRFAPLNERGQAPTVLCSFSCQLADLSYFNSFFFTRLSIATLFGELIFYASAYFMKEIGTFSLKAYS